VGRQGQVWHTDMIEYCIACEKRHEHSFWKARFDHRLNRIVYICGDHYRNRLTPEQKMKNLSPEEVMSGVHQGNKLDKNVFKKESREDWGTEYRRGVGELSQDLNH